MSLYGPIYGKEFDLPEIYQPVFGKESLYPTARPSQPRIQTILNADKVFNRSKILTSSILDYGSNLGHFCMSLEKAGCSGFIFGVERDRRWLDAARHIAFSVNSRCCFDTYWPESDVVLLLSVTHHNMLDCTYSGMKELFEFIVKSKTHTIYIEQATHLEWLPWAAKLVVPGNPFIHFMQELDSITEGKFNIRLIGMDRNERLNTVRPIYQLKRKINEVLNVNGEEFVAYDSWTLPFLGVEPLPFEPVYRYATNSDGRHYFLKWINNVWTKPVPKIEGFLLSDIFRFGITQFYDLKKIKEQMWNKYCGNADNMGDVRPWNMLVSENSNLYYIDQDERPHDPSIARELDGAVLTTLSILLDSTAGGN